MAGMQATWERWYITAFQALQVCLYQPLPCECGAQGAYCGIVAPDLPSSAGFPVAGLAEGSIVPKMVQQRSASLKSRTVSQNHVNEQRQGLQRMPSHARDRWVCFSLPHHCPLRLSLGGLHLLC